MARQNRWAAFGDAFNAVYNVGTTLGKDFDNLKILNQKEEDWKDAEGNQLTGAGLQQARYNALANIEDKWGDAKAGLALRTGAIDYATKDENLRFQNRTQDSRVAYEAARPGYLQSATGLNVANTDRLNLANDYSRQTNPSRITRDNAQFGAQGAAYADPSYLNSLIADQTAIANERGRDSTKAGVDNAYYGSGLYRGTLDSGANATIATNNMVQARDSGAAAVYNNPTYRAGLVARGETEGLTNQTDRRIAGDTQTQRYNTGVANADTAQATAQSGLVDARRQLGVNQTLSRWAQTGDPNNPESIRELVTAIGKLNPQAGWDLEKNYQTHEIGQMVHNSVRYKQEANNILQKGGLPGLQKWVDDHNGAAGVKLETDAKTGAIKMYETNPDGSVGRTIAHGANEEEFYGRLQGYLDPANMLAVSKQIYDSNLTQAQAEYNRAQARAKGNITLDGFIANRLSQNPSDPLALALAFKSNPEAVPDMVGYMQKQNMEGGLGNNAGSIPAGAAVPNPARPGAAQVNRNAPPNPTEEAAARNVVTSAMTLSNNLSLNDRAKLLQQNEDLLRKYQLYDNEAAKLATATEAQDAIRSQGVGEFLTQLGRLASGEGGPSNPRGLQAWQNSVAAARQKQQALSDPALLQIVLSDLQAQVARGNASTGNARPAGERRLEQLRGRVAELEQYIQTRNANQ